MDDVLVLQLDADAFVELIQQRYIEALGEGEAPLLLTNFLPRSNRFSYALDTRMRFNRDFFGNLRIMQREIEAAVIAGKRKMMP